MSATTKIEWCDSTFNPWIGCTRVSPACDDCYAARSTPARAMKVQWGAGQPRHRTAASTWKKPLQWSDSARYFRECRECGWRGVAELDAPGGWLRCGRCLKNDTLKPARRRVFCASLADVFDNEVPIEWRADLFRLIAATPNLHWLLLTKRIGNVERTMAPGPWPANIWLGATVVNQEEADRDIPKLLAVPARVRFLSIEPMLGPIDLRDPPNDIGEPRYSYLKRVDQADPSSPRIDWVIVGGESGPKARPLDVSWVRGIVRQCIAAGVPCHVKQLGGNVRDRNDAGFDAYGTTCAETGDPYHPTEWPEPRDVEENPNGFREEYQGAPVRIRLRDRKGGDLAEWPHDLRVREFPA